MSTPYKLLAIVTRTPGFFRFDDGFGYDFLDTPGVYKWGASDRLSDNTYAGNQLWKNYILRVSPLQWTLGNPSGGVMRVGKVGSIEINLDYFNSADELWLSPGGPPKNLGIQLYVSLTDDSSSAMTFLLEGILHIQRITEQSIIYTLYTGSVNDVHLLQESTNHNGDTVALPRAYGAVTYCRAMRVADVDGKQTFHSGYINSPTWYDDGVDSLDTTRVSSDPTNASYYLWKMNNTPVGEITVSGTGEQSTLSEAFIDICGDDKLNVPYDTSLARSPSPGIIHWQDTQIKCLDFLDEVCKINTHMVFQSPTILYLADMAQNNGTRTVSQLSNTEYLNERPVSILTSKWVDREAGQFRAPGGGAAAQCVRDIPRSASTSSVYPYGDENTIEPYHNDANTIISNLDNVLEYIHKSRASIEVPFSYVPSPGEQVTISDTSIKGTLDMVFYTRRIKIDLSSRKLELEGEGEIQ